VVGAPAYDPKPVLRLGGRIATVRATFCGARFYSMCTKDGPCNLCAKEFDIQSIIV